MSKCSFVSQILTRIRIWISIAFVPWIRIQIRIDDLTTFKHESAWTDLCQKKGWSVSPIWKYYSVSWCDQSNRFFIRPNLDTQYDHNPVSCYSCPWVKGDGVAPQIWRYLGYLILCVSLGRLRSSRWSCGPLVEDGEGWSCGPLVEDGDGCSCRPLVKDE